MKTKIFFNRIAVLLAVVVTVFLFHSCDNSFLEENQVPEYSELNDTIFVTNSTQPFELNLNFNNTQTCNWRVAQFPVWLDLYPKEGSKQANGNSTIQFTVNDSNIPLEPGFYTFPLVFDIDGKKMVGYTVALAHLGHPNMNVSTTSILFTNSYSSSLEIRNESYGILSWWIASAPNWLTAEKQYGLIDQYQSEEIKLSVDVNGLNPGEYTGTLIIQSNAENQKTVSIQVKIVVSASAYYGDYHQGQLIDARFSKTSDELIILTKSPNQLLFFSSEINNPTVVDLDRVPQCLAMTEDESTIAIGYSNSEITIYNTQSHNAIKTYNIGTIPLSVEFASNEWLYFIATNSYWNYLHSFNLNTQEIVRQKDGEGGMKTLKKVPGKSLLLSTRPGYSPDGLLLFDVSEPGQTDSVNLYHMDMSGYWLSDDGEKLFTGWKKIYNVPDFMDGNSFIPNEPPVTGQIDFQESQIVDCIAQQSSSGYIFVSTGFGWQGQTTTLKVYNDQTLVQQRSYDLNFVRPDFFSVYSTWYGRPFAMFPSENKKDLWLVQKYAEYDTDNTGIWSVAKVDITK